MGSSSPVVLDQTVVTSRLSGGLGRSRSILDVGSEASFWSSLSSGGGLDFSAHEFVSGGNSLLLFLSVVHLLLIGELGLSLSNLLNPEFVLTLNLVGLGSGDQNASKENHGEDKAGNRVVAKSFRVNNTNAEHGPPVHGVCDPEGKQASNDLDVVLPRVLVDTLVVSLIDGVVSVAVAGNGGSLTLTGGSVNSVLSHIAKNLVINKLLFLITICCLL